MRSRSPLDTPGRSPSAGRRARAPAATCSGHAVHQRVDGPLVQASRHAELMERRASEALPVLGRPQSRRSSRSRIGSLSPASSVTQASAASRPLAPCAHRRRLAVTGGCGNERQRCVPTVRRAPGESRPIDVRRGAGTASFASASGSTIALGARDATCRYASSRVRIAADARNRPGHRRPPALLSYSPCRDDRARSTARGRLSRISVSWPATAQRRSAAGRAIAITRVKPLRNPPTVSGRRSVNGVSREALCRPFEPHRGRPPRRREI